MVTRERRLGTRLYGDGRKVHRLQASTKIHEAEEGMTHEEFNEVMKPGPAMRCDSCSDLVGHLYKFDGRLYCEMCRTAAEAETVLLKGGKYD